MALSRPARPTNEGMGAASASPGTKTFSEEGCNGNPPIGQEEETVRLRAGRVCAGCRCGWLCCDCFLGCLTCKQRRRFCYCRWVASGTPGGFVRIHCEICQDLRRSCQCQLTYRCKWCTVSLEKCEHGGCVSLLPSRVSPEAAPYVEFFNRAEKSDEVAVVEAKVAENNDGEDDDKSGDDDADKQSLASQTTCSTAELSWEADSPSSVASGSTWSLGTVAGEEWWDHQRSLQRDDMSCSGEDDIYGSANTINSGGSFNSIGGKFDC